MNHIAIGIGEVLWDMFPEEQKIGGAPANFAYHVSQLGLNGYIASAVGKDILGDRAVETLERKGLRSIIQRADFPTGTVKITLNAHGIPEYSIQDSVAWDNITFDDNLQRLAAETDLVCFGSLAQRHTLSRNTICGFIDAMPNRNDTLKVFDINLRQNFYDKETLHESLLRCNVLKINDEELEIVSQMFGLFATDPKDRLQKILTQYGLKLVILTCGTNGSYILTSESVSYLQTPQIKVADTVGAGDSFTAAFCAALTHGKSIRESHELAVEVSAYVCTQQGSMPSLPAELKYRITG